MKLLSLEFIVLASCAIVLLPITRGPLRWILFLAFNLIYVTSYLTPAGMVSTGVFLLAGYGFSRWARSGGRVALITSIAALTLAFVYMRGYTLRGLLLPESWITDVLATAGLSFLFFKMLHVIVDSGSGTIGELKLGTYTNYCLNFTTFLLGPIQRYQDFSDQWHGRKPSIEDGFEPRVDAVNRILRGLVKKFVLVELMRRYSLQGVDVDSVSAAALVVKTWVFYLYLYCDFSGYCDIVIGVGALMGVRPPENFWLPFLSRNVSAYWLRVHRSLTLWLTDYIFNPTFAALLRSRLGGSPFLALAISLSLTMLVAGVWHGTTLSFLLFGLVHGVYLVVFRGYEKFMIGRLGRKRFTRFSSRPAVHVLAVFLTFNVTAVAYIFFVFDTGEMVRLIARAVGR